jgi:TATA-binding protein-associated factor
MGSRYIPCLVSSVSEKGNSLQNEENLDLQTRSAVAVSSFVDFCALHGLTQPPDKIVKNLCTFLCQDVEQTPTFAYHKKHLSGILSFRNPSKGAENDIPEEDKAETRERARLSRRGAGLAFVKLSTTFREKLLETIPKMWQSMAGGILSACTTGTNITLGGTATSPLILHRLARYCRRLD